MANLTVHNSGNREHGSSANPLATRGSTDPVRPLISLPPRIGQAGIFLEGRLFGD